jgi:methylated-DNA-[protein]-cysteine S-methyltransferase
MRTPKQVHLSHVRTSAVGTIWFAESDKGIWEIRFGSTREQLIKALRAAGITPERDEQRTAATRQALREYFSGARDRFDRPLDWSRLAGFDRRALRVCAKIPYGKTLSYGEIARRAGSPGGARAAGQAMGKNPFPIIVPCHRVISANGAIGGFGGGLELKRALLELEGIELSKRPRKRKTNGDRPPIPSYAPILFD